LRISQQLPARKRRDTTANSLDVAGSDIGSERALYVVVSPCLTTTCSVQTLTFLEF
jgi:hypothetical protein